MNYSELKSLKIDSEGFLVSEGLRLQDEEFGSGVLKKISVDGKGRVLSFHDGESLRLEAFDQPLVIQMIYREDNGAMVAEAPYHTRFNVDLTSLALDVWDRFHGQTIEGQPFVLTRKAQNELFDLADEFGDDWIRWADRTLPTPDYYKINSDAEGSNFWQQRYQLRDTPWDLEAPAPGLKSALKTLKLSKQRIAVLGCGTGEDAAYLATQGHLVTAFDFSEDSLKLARERHGEKSGLSFVHSDIFNISPEFHHSFDLVFEHTCFAAISPNRRPELVDVWQRLLHPTGAVLGIFLIVLSPNGPPYGLTEWELQQHFGENFRHLYWSREAESPPDRQELLVYSQLKAKS